MPFVKDYICAMQHGTPEAVKRVQQRRAEAVSEPDPSDHLSLLLLKHRSWDLWPVPLDQKLHLQRLLGMQPPIAAPAAPQQALPLAPKVTGRGQPERPQIMSPTAEHWSALAFSCPLLVSPQDQSEAVIGHPSQDINQRLQQA